MRRILLALILLAPLASAQAPPDAIEVTITISGDDLPRIDAPPGLVILDEAEIGERYSFNLTLTRDYTTFEVDLHDAMDIERPRQVVPSLVLNATEYPLFYDFPNDAIWDVDGPARVYFTNGTARDVVLRLGIPGPANVTLVLERDVTPPTFTLGKIENITTYSFYQETNTNELATGDLQIRAVGATDWVVNPTPVLHFRQRFPVQGLTPDKEYEARVVFTDWAGNNVTSETYVVRTAPAPVLPPVDVIPLSPEPNSTVAPGVVLVRARVESPVADVQTDGVRLFFDKREVTSEIEFVQGEVRYLPQTTLAPGKHSVSIEVTDVDGGKGEARWTFEVEGASSARDTPLSPVVAMLGLAVVALVLRRR